MSEEVKPVPIADPNAAPAPVVEPVVSAQPGPDGQPSSKPEPTDLELVMPGGAKQPQDWSDTGFRKEVAENYWKLKTYDTADEKRKARAVRKDRDLLKAALRGEENATHPLTDEIKEILKVSGAPVQPVAPPAAGSPWSALDAPEVKEELEGSPALAAAVKAIRAADDAKTAQFTKIAQDYKALLDKGEAGSKDQTRLDEAEMFNLQADIRDLTRTPHGKQLCETISQEVNGKADVREGAAILAQEFAELIVERANKGEAEPNFLKDVVEPEMKSYNISANPAPAPKPVVPQPTPPPEGGGMRKGGPGASEDVVDETKLTAQQGRDRAQYKFDGTKPTEWDTMEPGGTQRHRQRRAERGLK